MLRLAACLLLLAHGQDADDDTVSFLQTSQRLHLPRTKEGPSGNPMGTASSEGTVVANAEWPRPDSPNYTITPMHRGAVALFRSALQAGNVPVMNVSCQVMALLPVQLDVEEKVYDMLFTMLRNYSGDEYQYVQQSALRGLSDQANTQLGAAAISDLGGENEGVRFLVRHLKAHPQRLYGYCADQCTVQYESLAVIGGLILTDMTGSRTRVAMEEGLGEAVMHALRSEHDILGTVHTACRVMTYLLWHNASYAEGFKKAGALELIDEALVRFKDGDDTPFHFGFTIGQLYPVSQCMMPKLYMEGKLEAVSVLNTVTAVGLIERRPHLTFFKPETPPAR